MNTTKFPSLTELGRAALVSGSVRRALTRAQLDAQEELRAGSPGLSPGVILPWYASERRALTATGGTTLQQGGMTIANQIPELGEAFRASLVLERLGAPIFAGLDANISLPQALAEISAAWKSETAAATETDFEFSLLDLKPKRLCAFIDVSRQLLEQSETAEAFIRQELMSALAAEVQRVAINGSGEDDEPTGILQTSGIGDVAGGTNGAAPTYNNIVDLEHAVADAHADRGNLAWLVNPGTRRKLRKTVVLASTSSDAIWPFTSSDRLLGHPAGVTNSVPSDLTKGSGTDLSALVFGEMSELIIAFWGQIDVEVLTSAAKAKDGLLTFYSGVYVDVGVRHAPAFAAMKDAITS